jgi:hypothetical protein
MKILSSDSSVIKRVQTGRLAEAEEGIENTPTGNNIES